ncbi:voltage-gated potassium channel [Lepidopterella palustris CBS 459.81]|uniref:Voltage-gated potassium channel n=1 Tax=Lepidopterella palustris CBS 459.81 TaxID=1314670 RepID=A0A8E2ELG6_9PEZI|nr:voltage-gated potassium channel [Lepidopterella palustris CBS 459.81]
MASTLAPSTDILAEKPPSSDTSNSANNIKYDNANDEANEVVFSELSRPDRKKKWLKSKRFKDDKEYNWWFASTAIPLLAATLGPLANVLSIAALVTYWRMNVFIDGQFVADFDGHPFRDPRWCYWLNVASLIFGFLGNIFLLMNFTQRVQYIVALPMTIILWYFATGFLIGITACMHIYTPPNRPYETYTQGFWYAIIAACLYLVCSMILMVNMLGYFLGHYPATFTLTDAQRTLILQTMLFFIWLAGGGAVFSRIETTHGQSGWAFVDALYFCDVTILTVGFGDLYPTNDLGRGLVFPYSVGGIIMLGLVISSLHKFTGQIGEENIVQKHVERVRVRTMDRTVTNSIDLRCRGGLPSARPPISRASISGPSSPVRVRADLRNIVGHTIRRTRSHNHNKAPLIKKSKLILLREEKDRFDAMRNIQRSTARFKKWWALTLSIIAFGILWCVGAVVFWQAEKKAQKMTYFEALYFAYVSLLTIGYGDLSPKSNAGRCFFVVWSLIAVPTMTILVSDMGNTVISNFKHYTAALADFTVLPREGIWRSFLEKHPWLLHWIQNRIAARAAKRRLKQGFPTGPDPEEGGNDGPEEDASPPNLEGLAEEAEQDAAGHQPDEVELSRRLALSIRRVANDLKLDTPKMYSYEEWVEFTRLIRFTRKTPQDVLEEEEEEGLVEWDWIGKDSPMMAKQSETEFVLDRLCESLARYMQKNGKARENIRESSTKVHVREEENKELYEGR